MADGRALASNSGRFSVLLACVCDFADLGVEVQEMTKQAFWDKVGDAVDIATNLSSCEELCPVYYYFVEHGIDCESVGADDCINVIRRVYERLERESNDD